MTKNSQVEAVDVEELTADAIQPQHTYAVGDYVEDTHAPGLIDRVEIAVLDPNCVPVYKTEGAAGADLYTREESVIRNGKIGRIPLGVRLNIPLDLSGELLLRSSAPEKYNVRIPNGLGLIDSDFHGEISLTIENREEGVLVIPKHTRLCQIVFRPVVIADFNVVSEEYMDSLDTVRSAGFGDTGDN